MPGLSFLSKKSWHTSNISNQEKVWIAEQNAAAEEAKLKELTQQIKLEREQEELQKLTGKKSSSTTGDRGVDWMYEGHKKGDEEDDEEQRRIQEDAQNEAYLLGKEYVPEGQKKHAGDFAVAASMTGALEKASTVGATIGVGGQAEEEGGGLKIQDDGMTNNDTNNNGTGESSSVAAGSSTMNQWNQNFHLRHEDPMFSVMQRKQAKDKDVEKKIKLMERAGLVVKGVVAADETTKMQHDEQEDKDRERRRRKDSKKSKKKRKHKHNKHHRRHQKRSRREKRSRSRSEDGYSSYSSSESYSSEDSRRGRHYRRDDGRATSSRRHDDYDRHHHSSDRRRDRHDDRDDRRRKRRSESRERRRRERSSERYDDYYDRYERQPKRASSGRRRERSRSYSVDRDDPRGRRSRGDHGDYKGGDSRSSMREKDHYKYDDRKQPPEQAAAAVVAAPKSDSHPPKREGYGLIGTSLSNNNNKSSKSNYSSGDYLGPDQKLREAKRGEMERERQSRFVQGRKRQHRDNSEERQMTLEAMKRNARDREEKWSK